MSVQCRAYREDGTVCRRPATVVDPEDGELVCGECAVKEPIASGSVLSPEQRAAYGQYLREFPLGDPRD